MNPFEDFWSAWLGQEVSLLELCTDRLDDNLLVSDFGAEVMIDHIDVSGPWKHLGNLCYF